MEEEAQMGSESAIIGYGMPLAPVTSFKYLGMVLLAADDKWPVVVRDLRKACQKWAQLTRVMSREGADARTLGRIDFAVVQFFFCTGRRCG